MSSTVFTPLTKELDWVDATTNEDGSSISPGEITGFAVGARADGSAPVDPKTGAYPLLAAVTSPTATSEAAADMILAMSLTPGNYWGSVRSTGPTNSQWATEVPFSIPAPLPVPNPPTGLSVS
jgi:hypothetical protein